MDAIGLNRSEVNFRRGKAPRLPAGLGTEAAGVLEIGADVPRWSVGDEVTVVPAFSQHDYPVYAAEAVVPAAALVGRPDGLGAVSSAAVWMPYVTVYGVVAEVVRCGRGTCGGDVRGEQCRCCGAAGVAPPRCRADRDPARCRRVFA